METTNTGLGLIKTTIERVQNQNSLFTKALKKLVNSNEKQLSAFLGEAVQYALKNLAFFCICITGSVTEFIVGEKFQQREKKKVGVQLYIYDNFRNWLLEPMKGVKVSLEETFSLKKFKLTKEMHDTEIQSELQNPNPIDVKVFLPLLWSMLIAQKNGEAKDDGLIVTGYTNIFHVKLGNGRVVAVGVIWHDGEWRLDALGLDDGNRWNAGLVFFTPATA